MLLFTDSDASQAGSAAFIALPLLGTNALTNTPDCVFKTCCKKYKKGKRCKNCPKK